MLHRYAWAEASGRYVQYRHLKGTEAASAGTSLQTATV
jgi:hypothetical protein